MSKLFHPDSVFMHALSRLIDLVVLNILTVVFSMPIITIGASFTALYEVIGRMKTKEGKLYSSYLRAFRDNFKKATIIWLILLVTLLLLFTCLYINYANKPVNIFLFILCSAAVLLWLFMTSWVFPLQAKFENTIIHTLRNSVILSLINIPQTIFLSLLNLIPFIVIFFPNTFVYMTPVWLLIWFSVIAGINSKIITNKVQFFIDE